MTACPFCASSLPENNTNCPSCGATLAGLQLELGTVLLGKYRLEEVLGQGGFGITYKAFDLSLNRFVAIKELFPEGCIRHQHTLIPASSLGAIGFAQTKQRFLEEAQTLAQFNHAGIVRVFEVFEANNTAYIVMEALSGETLGAVISRLGQLPEKEVIRIAEAVCAALEVVHQTGLLHRDIKPDNLYITKDDRVVLIDFGSARGFQAGRAMRHTQLVSPGYAAPEQYASQAKFGTYTDVYGLSATLYHAAFGKPPPTASDRIISSDTSLHLPSSLQEPLRIALTRGLALRIDERPQTAKDLKQLVTCLDLEQIPASGNSNLNQSQRVHDGQEEIIFRKGNLLITNQFIQIPASKGEFRYNLADLSDVWVTNKWKESQNNDGLSEVAQFIFAALSLGSAALLFFSRNFTGAPFFLIIGIILTYSVLSQMYSTGRRDLFYLVIKTKEKSYLTSVVDKRP